MTKHTLRNIIFLCISFSLVFWGCVVRKSVHTFKSNAIEPVLDNKWWQVADVPDIGEYNNDLMEPVDFAVWQATDGTWQLVSCIRYCGRKGDFRVLHRWEGKNLTDTLWEPKGIFMKSDSALGEQHGWIQAPYVVKKNGIFKFYYGGGGQICLAEGYDGKNFQRQIQSNGKTKIIECEEYDRGRDIMIMNYNNKYYGYYTGSTVTNWPDGTKGAVFCRISDNLGCWGKETKVSETKENVIPFFSSECPHVITKNGYFFLFKTQEYKPGEQQTTIFRSKDPLNFGINSDSYKIRTIPISAPEIIIHNNKYYIAALMPDLKGIRICELNWENTK